MRNVLIADDEKVVRELVRRIIVSLDVNIFLAEDGLKAIEIAKKNPIDLAILDIRMPGIDGIKTFQELRRINNKTLAVFMTGYAVEEKLLDIMKRPGTICMKKPFDDILSVRNSITDMLKKIEDNDNNTDRRSYVRLPISSQVSFVIKDQASQRIRSNIKNVCPVGMLLNSREEIKSGAILSFFSGFITGDDSYLGDGEVIWCKKVDGRPDEYDLGIRLLNLDVVDLIKIINSSSRPRNI